MIGVMDTQIISDVKKELTETELVEFEKICQKYNIGQFDQIIGWYRNGNYVVVLFSNGTKIRFNDKSDLIPEFAECIDITITHRCSVDCDFCYQGCQPNGEFADLRWKDDFFNSLHPYTELAMALNDLDHPDLEEFLIEASKRKVLVNGTVNIQQALDHQDLIVRYQDMGLLHGIGISCNTREPNQDLYHDVQTLKDRFDNPVIHVVSGIVTQGILDELSGLGLNLLILGYKETGRGLFYSRVLDLNVQKKEIALLKWVLYQMSLHHPDFRSISFDTTAIKRFRNSLCCKPEDVGKLDSDPRSINSIMAYDRKIDEETFNHLSSGDDGQFTFFIDFVDGVHAKNSTTRVRYSIPESMNVDDMFRVHRS